jgi:hypothetical protein
MDIIATKAATMCGLPAAGTVRRIPVDVGLLTAGFTGVITGCLWKGIGGKGVSII